MLAAAILGARLLSVRTAASEERDPRTDEEVSRRLAFIETRLDRATTSATVWWSAWFYGYIAVTVGEAGVALGTTNLGQRKDSAVGAAFATLGVLGMGVFDFPPRHASSSLGALPAATAADRRLKLARAERMLAACARAEVIGRSWVPHVAGVGVTLVSSLVLALAYKRVGSSIVTGVSGVALTEAQIFTRPTAAIDDWRAYGQGAFARGVAPPPAMRLSVFAGSGGGGIRGVF